METITRRKLWTVGELAERARVTVRTLHHYDEIGLLVPAARSEAGYRLYSETDLQRLFQIVLYRELGLPLDAIADMLEDPGTHLISALRQQRARLIEKRRKATASIRALDRILDSLEEGTAVSSDQMFEGFDALGDAPEEVRRHQARFGAEARERWGDTDAYKESTRRTRGYSRADWERLRAEGNATEGRMADLLAAGADPDGEQAMSGAEAMRQHISRWFYSCSHEMHSALADMYEADPRFTEHYEKRAPGLTAFVATAIRANTSRAQRSGPREA